MFFVIISKLLCLFLVFFIFFLCLFYIPIGYTIRLFSVKWSVRISQYFSYALWEVCDIIFRLTFTINPNSNSANCNKENINLIISNHVSAMDFMILNSIFKTKGTMKYLIKEETKYLPIFYQMIDLLRFIIVSRNYQKDEKVIKDRLDSNSIIALFPEGTRVNKKNLKKSRDFSIQRGYPVLNNVLYPRYNGFRLILDTLGNINIADLTFTHKETVPSLWQVFFTSYRGEIKYDLRIINTQGIEDQKKWLEESFLRKDSLIQSLKEELE